MPGLLRLSLLLSYAHQTTTPEAPLLAVSDKLNSLQRLEYNYHLVLDYPAEKYHSERKVREYLEFNAKNSVLGVRFKFDYEDTFVVFNGSNLFTCDSNKKTLNLETSRTKANMDSTGGMLQSPYWMKQCASHLAESPVVKRKFLPIQKQDEATIEVTIDGSWINSMGDVKKADVNYLVEITVDKKTLLPTKVVRRLPENGTMTTYISNYKVNPKPIPEKTYDYSYFAKTYPNSPERALTPLAPGVDAPNFELKTHNSQDLTSLSSLKGKYVLLGFFIVHCGACIESIPKLNKWRKKFASVEFKSINIGDSFELVDNFVKKNKLELPVIIGNSKVAKIVWCSGLPYNVPHRSYWENRSESAGSNRENSLVLVALAHLLRAKASRYESDDSQEERCGSRPWGWTCYGWRCSKTPD